MQKKFSVASLIRWVSTSSLFMVFGCGQGIIESNQNDETNLAELSSAADKIYDRMMLDEMAATLLPRRSLYRQMDPSWAPSDGSEPFELYDSETVFFNPALYSEHLDRVIDLVDNLLQGDVQYLKHLAPVEDDTFQNGGPLAYVMQRTLCLMGDMEKCPNGIPDWAGRIDGELIAQLVCTDWGIAPPPDSEITIEEAMTAFWDPEGTLGTDLWQIKQLIIQLWDTWEKAGIQAREANELPIMYTRRLDTECSIGAAGDSTGLLDEADFLGAVGWLAGLSPEQNSSSILFELFQPYLNDPQLPALASQLRELMAKNFQPLDQRYQILVNSVNTQLTSYPELLTLPGMSPNQWGNCSQFLGAFNDLWHQYITRDSQPLYQRLLQASSLEEKQTLIAEGIAQYRRLIECSLEKVHGIGGVWEYHPENREYNIDFPLRRGVGISLFNRLGMDHLALEIPLVKGAALRMVNQKKDDLPLYTETELREVFGDWISESVLLPPDADSLTNLSMTELQEQSGVLERQLEQSSWGRAVHRTIEYEKWVKIIDTGLDFVGYASILFTMGGGNVLLQTGKKLGLVAIDATLSRLFILRVAGIGLLAKTSDDLMQLTYLSLKNPWEKTAALYPNTAEGFEAFRQDQYAYAKEVLNLIGDSFAAGMLGRAFIAEYRATMVTTSGETVAVVNPRTTVPAVKAAAEAPINWAQRYPTKLEELPTMITQGEQEITRYCGVSSVRNIVAFKGSELRTQMDEMGIQLFMSASAKDGTMIGYLGGKPAVVVSAYSEALDMMIDLQSGVVKLIVVMSRSGQ